MSLIPPSLIVSTAQRLATTILYPLCVKYWGVAARRSEPTVVQKGEGSRILLSGGGPG
jgi:hypothetical protein